MQSISYTIKRGGDLNQSSNFDRRYYDNDELMITYKTKVLSYVEYRTPAIYHATTTLLEQINAIQNNFLRDIGINPVQALTDYHLAPLSARRDMAMLGVIHRSVLGLGPPHFNEFFQQNENPAQT